MQTEIQIQDHLSHQLRVPITSLEFNFADRSTGTCNPFAVIAKGFGDAVQQSEDGDHVSTCCMLASQPSCSHG